MATWIALLRGINVGGHHKLPMAALRAELESLGLEEVQTYIQSGNAVFRSESADATGLADAIAARVEESHGFRPRVLVLSREDWQAALEANPFPEAEPEPKTLHLLFLAEPAQAPRTGAIDAALADSERYLLTDRVFYLHAPEGLGRSKLASNVERFLGVDATGRNWRTVNKLAELAEDSLG